MVFIFKDRMEATDEKQPLENFSKGKDMKKYEKYFKGVKFPAKGIAVPFSGPSSRKSQKKPISTEPGFKGIVKYMHVFQNVLLFCSLQRQPWHLRSSSHPVLDPSHHCHHSTLSLLCCQSCAGMSIRFIKF